MEPSTPTPPQRPTISTPVAVLISGALIAGAIVYAFGYAPKPAEKTAGTQETKPIPAVTAEDHRVGAADAKLILVEYSDMECPFCGDFHPVVKQLVAEKGNEIAWVYRHFPLTQIHPQALPAALASECVAQAKGNDAFWNFTNAIFAQQANLGPALLESVAAQQGVNKDDLSACMGKEETVDIIRKQFTDAAAAGAGGTPYTVVLDADGEQVAVFPGTLTYAELKAQIEALLAEQ